LQILISFWSRDSSNPNILYYRDLELDYFLLRKKLNKTQTDFHYVTFLKLVRKMNLRSVSVNKCFLIAWNLLTAAVNGLPMQETKSLSEWPKNSLCFIRTSSGSILVTCLLD